MGTVASSAIFIYTALIDEYIEKLARDWMFVSEDVGDTPEVEDEIFDDLF
jgi:hypothetical protein